jgi:ABC-type Mn2+/Zn2+ transport system ATPase subunit
MNDRSRAIQPLSVELGDENSRPFKSIDRIVWRDIPGFAVLTGVNGSGKTQLLQALVYKFSGARHQSYHDLNALPFNVIGDRIDPYEIAYLPNSENSFRIEGTNISNLHQTKQNFLQRLSPENVAHNIDAFIQRERIQRQFRIEIRSHQISPDLIAKLPDDFTYMLEYGEVSAGLSHVFVGYQIRRAEKLMDGSTELQVREDLGEPPWDFVNEALASAEFAYRILPPENRLMKDYRVKAVTLDGKTEIDLNDLSSGERMILRTIFWFYNSKHNNLFPKLFLLDEPDAHLHPSMTRQFIDVLKNVLVDQYGVRIVLTTHSPSTVALAPDESLFVMSREQPRIRRPASKAEAIGLLTSGLVTVSQGTKFVLVEDELDVRFYSAVRDILVDQGPSKDPKALKPAPTIVFMPASAGKGSTKISGGKNVVAQWVEKFDTAPLSQMFRGVIDRDEANTGGSRIHLLKRYSIENYQLDPTSVFGILIEEKKAPPLANVPVTAGDEHLLRTLSGPVLQSVVDYVFGQVEPVLTSKSDRTPMSVEFTNGLQLNYPAWMLNTRGHDLLTIFQRVFGQAIMTPPRLERSFRRVRLVPLELAEIMSELQNA